MTAKRLFWVTFLLAMGAASPAWATLEDPTSVLDAQVDGALDTALKNMHADAIDVVLLRALPGDPDGLARIQFDQHRLGADAGVLMIGTETHSVGAYFGEGYRSRGVDGALVRKLAKRVYDPVVAKGETSDAVLALVGEIKLARTLGRDPAAPPPAPAKESWLPWWWYLPPVLLAAAGGAGWWVSKRRRSRRRRARLERLVNRLEDLQYQLKKLEPAREQLRRADAEGAPEPGLRAADEGNQRELEAVEGLVTGVGSALKAGDWEGAERGLADAEARLFPLASALATASAAHQARLRGEDPAPVLRKGAEALARWQRLAEARGRWAATEDGASGSQQLGERLEALGKLLTTAPLDVAGALDFLDATEAVYGRALSALGQQR